MAIINDSLRRTKMFGSHRSGSPEMIDSMVRQDKIRKEKRIDLPGIKSSVATALNVMTTPVSKDSLAFGEQDVHSPLIVLRNNLRRINGEKYMFGVVFGLAWRDLEDGRTSAEKLSFALDAPEESVRDIKTMSIYGFEMPYDETQGVGCGVVNVDVPKEGRIRRDPVPAGIDVARMIDYTMNYEASISGAELRFHRKNVSEFEKLAFAALDVIVDSNQVTTDLVNWVPRNV